MGCVQILFPQKGKIKMVAAVALRRMKDESDSEVEKESSTLDRADSDAEYDTDD